jgi:hypothetical protein
MSKKKSSPVPQPEAARKPVFSVTRKDLIIDTFTAGGPGGQHQNTSNTAVRIRHPASGAAGECREHRSQHQNKAEALRRMVADKRFQVWKDKMLWGTPEPPEEWVERQMAPQNLLIMSQGDNGWRVID